MRACVANSKAYNEKKRLREEAEDAEDSSFEYRSIYFYEEDDVLIEQNRRAVILTFAIVTMRRRRILLQTRLLLMGCYSAIT